MELPANGFNPFFFFSFSPVLIIKGPSYGPGKVHHPALQLPWGEWPIQCNGVFTMLNSLECLLRCALAWVSPIQETCNVAYYHSWTSMQFGAAGKRVLTTMPYAALGCIAHIASIVCAGCILLCSDWHTGLYSLDILRSTHAARNQEYYCIDRALEP